MRFLFCSRFMSKQLSARAYLTFAFGHIFISSFAFLLIGFLYAKSEQLTEIIVHLDSTKYDQLKIMQKIWSNCSELTIDYPELHVFPHVKPCKSYDFALKLEKIVMILLILYYIYLFKVLYGSIFVPVIMMSFLSTFIFHFTNDQWTMILFQSLLVLMGVVIIVGHCLLTDKNGCHHGDIRSKKDEHKD